MLNTKWFEHFQIYIGDIVCRHDCDECEACYRDYNLGIEADILRVIAILAQELSAIERDADRRSALNNIKKHARDLFMMYRGLSKTPDGKCRKFNPNTNWEEKNVG